MTGVFGTDQIGFGQRFQRARREVIEMADGRGNDVEAAWLEHGIGDSGVGIRERCGRLKAARQGTAMLTAARVRTARRRSHAARKAAGF